MSSMARWWLGERLSLQLLPDSDGNNTAGYIYNALGWRVEKKVGSAYTEILYDQSGESLGEYNRSSWTQSAKNGGE